MNNSNSGKLSKGDIISFIALLILGVTVFFGINFMTLGNKISSVVIAILLFIIMIIFVFLAAHAKAQDRNQSTWRKVEYTMITLYIIALIPCYIYSAKFFDIQINKHNIIQISSNDIKDINDMFSDYIRKCEARCNNFQTELEALSKYKEGREQIVKLFKLEKNESQITQNDIEEATESFRKSLLKAPNISNLKSEKNNLLNNCENKFKNWNILLIPYYASELGEAKKSYANKLEEIYSKNINVIEKEAPEFNTISYTRDSNIKDIFRKSSGFSIIGIIAILVLGSLGLIKWILGERSVVIPMKEGNANNITEDGGFTF